MVRDARSFPFAYGSNPLLTMATIPEEPTKLESLIRCLHRYVEDNTDRFRVREERTGQQTILRVILADDLQEDERRLLRPVQLGQSERDVD